MTAIEVITKDATSPTGATRPGRLILLGAAKSGDGALKRVQRSEQLAPLVGEGILREYGAKVLSVAADQLFIPIAPSTPGTVSSVTQTGSGPLIAVSGDPLGAFDVKVKVTKAGTQSSGLARFTVATNGVTYNTTSQTIKPETAAEVVGTVNLNTGGLLASLAGQNFELETEDGNPVLYTMGAEVSVAALIVALNAAITADSSNATVQAALRQGKYLAIRSGTTGSASELIINNATGEGDAMPLLGLDGQFGQGTAASYGELVGTVDMTTLDYSTLNTKVFTCLTEDGNSVSYTIGVVANFAALVAALNGGIVADSSNAVVEATLRDGKYMVVRTGAVGDTKVITSNGLGGMGLLGIRNQTVTGADSTYEIPGTGLTIAFPAGTYPEGTIYSFTTTAPRLDLATVQAAIGAVPLDDGTEFDTIAIIEENWVDLDEMRAFRDAIAADLASKRQGEPYRPLLLAMGCAVTEADTDIRLKFADVDDEYEVFAVGDCYATGADLYGSHRRSALLPLVMQLAGLDLSQSIGDRAAGAIDVSMVGPDGTTLARNENTASVEMSDRYNVLLKYKGGTYFAHGRTLAGPAKPGFKVLAYMRPFLGICQIVHDVLAGKLEATLPLNPDKTLKAEAATDLDDAMQNACDLFTDAAKNGIRQRLSSVVAKYDRTNPFGDTKKYVAEVKVQHLGIAESGTVTASLVSEQE